MKHSNLIPFIAAAGLVTHSELAQAQTTATTAAPATAAPAAVAAPAPTTTTTATTTTTTTTTTPAPAAAPAVAVKATDAAGKPPAEVKSTIADVKVADAPAIGKPSSIGTTVTLSAGAMMSTGNSRAQAITATAGYVRAWESDTLGFGVVGNYTESAKPGEAMAPTVQNLQAKVRYDRAVSKDVALFFQTSGTHDRFQGLDVRFNIDPGVLYKFHSDDVSALWGEGGADIQYDIRNNASVWYDGDKKTARIPTGEPISKDPSTTPMEKTGIDYSARLYGGYRRALNANTTFFTGLEYLQSLQFTSRYRLNWDAVVAAKLTDGLSLGVSFKVRYDNQPLPGKENTDTQTTVQVIYAFSDTAKK